MLVWHLVLARLNEISFLGICQWKPLLEMLLHIRTSASDQALPPPVETVLRCRCATEARRPCESAAEFDLTIMGFCVGA